MSDAPGSASVADARASAAARSVRRVLAAAYFRWLPVLAVLLGIALRTVEWARNRSLWLDEYAIAENLSHRDYRELLRPLSDNQGAPVGWLWAERTAINAFGVNERALRLVPFLASLVAVVLFARLAPRLIGPLAAPAATVLFATSPALIYYASETKQYSSDVACVLGVSALTATLLRRQPNVVRTALWTAGCGLLAWCAHPAFVVSGGAAVVLLVRWVRVPRALAVVLAGCVLLAGILFADYWVSLRALARNGVLRSYWQVLGGYPPTTGGLAALGRWLQADTVRLMRDPFQLTYPIVTLLLAGCGLVVLARRRPAAAMLIAGPLLLGVAVAVTHHYPLAQRLALYLVPYLLLLLSAGLVVATWPLPARFRAVQVGGVGVLVAALVVTAGPGLVSGVGKFARSDEVTAGRETTDFVAAHRDPTDVVLADVWAGSAIQFYGPRRHVVADGTFWLTGATQRCGPDPLARFASQRVWAVFAHHPSNQPASRTRIYLSYFAVHGTLIQQYLGVGDAGAYLFDFGQPPSPPPRPLPSWFGNACLTLGPPPPTPR